MRLIERHYGLLSLANWVVPVAWILVAKRLHTPTWIFFVGLLLGFVALNYRITTSRDIFDSPKVPQRRAPVYFSPAFWMLVSLVVYFVYLDLKSQWLLYYLLIAGSIGACVATYFRWRHKAASKSSLL